ncbi:MAG TPA: hypothetical protein VN709_07420 [Terriglobales bacterium]|nr:hypothetical protein [Terriglobales bacterium]
MTTLSRFLLCLAAGLALFAPAVAQDAIPPAASPLSFKIGAFDFAPGGFLDFTTVYRSTNVGSGIGTNFAGIPYNNTVAGRLTELRESAQNSRLTLKVSGVHDGTDYYGYLETDFLGNQPSNVAVSSNSDTVRMRVYFVDARHGGWEMLAGQDWSLLTPNKVGLSPMPSDLFYGQNMDTNYQVGLTWARQPQFRLMYHASDHLVAGVSVENAEPYIGGSSGAPTVVLPGTVYASQVNSGASNFSAPGFTPDVIGKVAFDTATGGHGLHFEVAGLESEFRTFTPATNLTQRAAGGGVSVNANAEVAKGLHLIATSFLGDGGGRYFFGMVPDMIIRQNGAVSPVLTQGGIGGFEYQVNPGYLAFAYYGGINIKRDFDLSGMTPVGYGFPGAPSSMNRTIQEGTFGIVHTFWKSAQYGALQLITQASYLVRTPYTVSAGAPKNAHTGMGFVDLRYTLP